VVFVNNFGGVYTQEPGWFGKICEKGSICAVPVPVTRDAMERTHPLERRANFLQKFKDKKSI